MLYTYYGDELLWSSVRMEVSGCISKLGRKLCDKMKYAIKQSSIHIFVYEFIFSFDKEQEFNLIFTCKAYILMVVISKFSLNSIP